MFGSVIGPRKCLIECPQRSRTVFLKAFRKWSKYWKTYFFLDTPPIDAMLYQHTVYSYSNQSCDTKLIHFARKWNFLFSIIWRCFRGCVVWTQHSIIRGFVEKFKICDDFVFFSLQNFETNFNRFYVSHGMLSLLQKFKKTHFIKFYKTLHLWIKDPSRDLPLPSLYWHKFHSKPLWRITFFLFFFSFFFMGLRSKGGRFWMVRRKRFYCSHFSERAHQWKSNYSEASVCEKVDSSLS